MRTRAILLVILFTLYMQETYASKIVTIFDDENSSSLSRKAEEIPITKAGLIEAKDIADQLIATLTPKMPAAGLAAPQINISKQIVIFSWDRSMDHMLVAINPKITEYSEETQTSWESCFSTRQENGPSKIALVTRYNWIIVEYFDLDGQKHKQRLEGFAAKVFQHEYDHLAGIENTSKKGATVKSFSTKSQLTEFMTKVKKADSINYTKPVDL